MRPDSLLRFWRYINHLLTYLLYWGWARVANAPCPPDIYTHPIPHLFPSRVPMSSPLHTATGIQECNLYIAYCTKLVLAALQLYLWLYRTVLFIFNSGMSVTEMYNVYMGPHFLTQPNIRQTHEYLGRTRVPTWPKPKAVQQLSINYSKYRLPLCMHVKIKMNMRHKSPHSINIKLSSVTRGSSSHLASDGTSSTDSTLSRLSWSDVAVSNIMDACWKFYYWTNPTQPLHGGTPIHVHQIKSNQICFNNVWQTHTK